jgi:hypothetical protein
VDERLGITGSPVSRAVGDTDHEAAGEGYQDRQKGFPERKGGAPAALEFDKPQNLVHARSYDISKGFSCDTENLPI